MPVLVGHLISFYSTSGIFVSIKVFWLVWSAYLQILISTNFSDAQWARSWHKLRILVSTLKNQKEWRRQWRLMRIVSKLFFRENLSLKKTGSVWPDREYSKMLSNTRSYWLSGRKIWKRETKQILQELLPYWSGENKFWWKTMQEKWKFWGKLSWNVSRLPKLSPNRKEKFRKGRHLCHKQYFINLSFL